MELQGVSCLKKFEASLFGARRPLTRGQPQAVPASVVIALSLSLLVLLRVNAPVLPITLDIRQHHSHRPVILQISWDICSNSLLNSTPSSL